MEYLLFASMSAVIIYLYAVARKAKIKNKKLKEAVRSEAIEFTNWATERCYLTKYATPTHQGGPFVSKDDSFNESLYEIYRSEKEWEQKRYKGFAY